MTLEGRNQGAWASGTESVTLVSGRGQGIPIVANWETGEERHEGRDETPDGYHDDEADAQPS